MGVDDWNGMTPEERKLSSRAMEAYAGMHVYTPCSLLNESLTNGRVDSIDTNVGKIMQYLQDSGEYDNTCIVFMSDNGAEGAALEAARRYHLIVCSLTRPLISVL